MLKWIARLFGSSEVKVSAAPPTLVCHRSAGQNAVVVFVHGFSGDATATWTQFVDLLMKDDVFAAWDVYSVGYPTSLSLDFPIWTADPDIRVCAKGLVTRFRHAPLNEYKAVVFVSHSMGGLVVQRAVLDDPVLRGRVSHFLMFGTPSGGLSKAVIGSRLKNQAKDMGLGSTFIASLREEWSKVFSVTTPFHFRTVAGDRDAFVPASSSLDPFPSLSQDVVPGDHLSIVRPVSADSYSYQVLKKMVSPGPFVRSSVESARLAVEHLEFTEAIDTLLPNFEGLDDNAIVTLSLALESVGRREDALATLERWRCAHPECNLDARGALAGRLKRRWLTSRQKSDYDESIHLYTSALEDAEAIGDHNQAHYHAINVAYLLLEDSAIGSAPTTDIVLMAQRALDHAQQCLPDRWALATSGEAYLILGDTEKALVLYGAASRAAKTMREKESMALQAISVASRLCNYAENKRLRELLNFPAASLQKNG